MKVVAADLDAYAERIGFKRPLDTDVKTLRALHRAHLGAIPFENASVMFGERIEMDQPGFVRKLGRLRRGGFCYELNGGFAALLIDAGFDVSYLEARVFGDGGRLGPRFDHLVLRVTLAEPWLVDVGFGYSFLEPLRLATEDVQDDPIAAFRLRAVDEGVDLEWRHRDGAWVPHYRFDPEPRRLEEFAATCAYQQDAPESPFVNEWICSVLDADGGTTLSGRRLIVSAPGSRTETEVAGPDLPAVLLQHFGIHASLEAGRWVRVAG